MMMMTMMMFYKQSGKGQMVQRSEGCVIEYADGLGVVDRCCRVLPKRSLFQRKHGIALKRALDLDNDPLKMLWMF